MSSNLTPSARVHLIVRGRVQGVFFRASAQELAEQLGLVGWARNTPDGAVEIVAEGPRDQLKQLRDWAKSGPPGAAVDRVEEANESPTGEFRRFSVHG